MSRRRTAYRRACASTAMATRRVAPSSTAASRARRCVRIRRDACRSEAVCRRRATRVASRATSAGASESACSQRCRGADSKRAGGKPPERSRRNIARAVRSTTRHAPAPAPTAVPHAIEHMIAAPIAPPSETGSSKPNSKPPARIATGGAKIIFAARRVGASSAKSASQ